MSKSTLHLLDAEDQLASMKLADENDPKSHLGELKVHFQTMLQLLRIMTEGEKVMN